MMDKLLRGYIQGKLHSRETMAISTQRLHNSPGKRGAIKYDDPEQIADDLDWKNKYELVTRAKIQKRDILYFQNQSVHYHT